MNHVYFVPTNGWSIEHPVYALVREYIKPDWAFCANERDADLVLAPTRPWYDGDKPWIVMIEDWVTLYNTEINNGNTIGIDVINHPKTAWLREQFSRPNFRGIVCHHRGTFRDLAILNLTDKLFYVPIGVPHRQPMSLGFNKDINFIFINSWRQGASNFTHRGGDLLLYAFRKLYELGQTKISLTVCSGIAATDEMKSWLFQCPKVKMYEDHLVEETLRGLVASSDCLVLPAHRVHAHSIILPMSFGVPVITSDGWGMSDYVIDGINGMIAPTAEGLVTYTEDGDVFREDYACHDAHQDARVKILALKMHLMSENSNRRAQMGRAAHDFVNDVHSMERASRLMKQVFNEAI